MPEKDLTEIKTLIARLRAGILKGDYQITPGEALQLINLESEEAVDILRQAAHAITLQYHTDRPECCSLVNAKSYLCGEDCAFCSQSVHYKTKAPRYPLMKSEEIVAIAKKFEKLGIRDFCVVTSGAGLNDAEFEQVLETFKMLRSQTSLNLDGSLGFLTPERIQRLKAAGVRRINNNLQCSRNYYSKIVSTHTHDKRAATLRLLQEGGMEICSGALLGMGESREDRVQMAFEIKPYAPHCFPVNILIPHKGTPLENQPKIGALEILKTIAVFRLIHPQANIKLAGGREVNLSPEEQEKALTGGANGLIMGGYLTSGGNPLEADYHLLKRAGYKINEQFQPAGSSATL